MGKKEKREKAAVAAAADVPETTVDVAAGVEQELGPQVEEGPPWWLDEICSQPVSIENISFLLYLVTEESVAHADLTELLIKGICSGVRRKFSLLELSTALARIPDKKHEVADIKRAKGRDGKAAKGGKRGDRKSGRTAKGSAAKSTTTDPVEAMLDAAALQLSSDGKLSAEMTAMILKQALLQLLQERSQMAGIGDKLIIPQAEESTKQKLTKLKLENLHKNRHRNTSKTPQQPEETKEQKEKQKNDKGFESFCKTKQFSLRKRNEPVDPEYKDDEPKDGPDLYIILVGCHDPAMPRALAKCGVIVEALVKLSGARCRMNSFPVDSAHISSISSRKSIANEFETDPTAAFWSDLPANLISCNEAPDLRDTAVIPVSVDRCRIQIATSPSAAADDLYTEVAHELYRYLKLRQLFSKYREAVVPVPVPEAPRPPSEPTSEGHATNDAPDGISDVDPLALSDQIRPPLPPPDPCLGEPTEYRRLLQNIPLECVSVALIVNAIVEQVCAWQNVFHVPVEHNETEETVDQPKTVEETDRRGANLGKLSEPYALQMEFEPQNVDTTSGPVLVNEGDAVNAQFFDWKDREVVLSIEHVLALTEELHCLQCQSPAPDICLWRYQATRQQLIDSEGGPRSQEAADHALRLLIFESMYPALSTPGGVAVKPYPHPFLPEQTVCPDVQYLTAECGEGQLAEGAKMIDSRDVLVESTAKFSHFRVWERLDRMTMAQQLRAARETRQLLAAYHFGGDDGLYLVYGQPRVWRGSMKYSWSSRAHTNVGFRDFLDNIKLWPEVSEWMHVQHQELIELAEPVKVQPPDVEPLKPQLPDEVIKPADQKECTEKPSRQVGFQLPDSVFIIPGSIKYEQTTGIVAEWPRKKEGLEKEIEPKEKFKSKARKREKKVEERKDSTSPRRKSRSDSKFAREENDTEAEPPRPSLSVVEYEIRPKSAGQTIVLGEPSSPAPLAKMFPGYDVQLGRLLSVEGHQRRQYFSNGSHVTVNRSEFVQGPSKLWITVCHEDTQLTLHTSDTETGENDVVALLSGGILMHPRPVTCVEELQPLIQLVTPAADSITSTRKSFRRKSPSVREDRLDKRGKRADKKRDSKKVERGWRREKGGRKRTISLAVDVAPSELVEAIMTEVQSQTEQMADSTQERVPETRRVQTLTLSCPSGLVVELLPDPFWPEPEPRVRVVQYYLDAACQRRDIRIHLADGTLLCMDGDTADDALISMYSIDGGLRIFKRFGDTLQPVSEISPTGRRIVFGEDAPESRPFFSKVATDPVTGELYIEREDGMRGVIRPGGQAVLHFGDGTRVTMTSPPINSLYDEREDPRPPGCSDYIVNEAGWIGKPRLTWLLGARVQVDDAAGDQIVVLTEHPRYARVQMDQRCGRCTVDMPGGVYLDVSSSGVFQLVQPNGAYIQLDTQVLCFSTLASEDCRPVVHTLRLGPPEPPAPLLDPPPPVFNVHKPPDSPSVAVSADDGIEASGRKSSKANQGAEAQSELKGVPQVAGDRALQMEAEGDEKSSSWQSQEAEQHKEGLDATAEEEPNDLEPSQAIESLKDEEKELQDEYIEPPQGVESLKDEDLQEESEGGGAREPAPPAPMSPVSSTVGEPVSPAPTHPGSSSIEEPVPPVSSKPPVDILCESVDATGVVWHVTKSGELVRADGEDIEELPEPIPLEMREQVDEETVFPELPLFFVLYREGDGIRMLTGDEAERYLNEVDATPSSLISCTPHVNDPDINVWTTFRPVSQPLSERWCMAYLESNLIPPNLRCRDLRLLSPECEPPVAGSTVWGKEEVMLPSSAKPLKLPSGLVATRELLVTNTLSHQRRHVTLEAVHEARVRYRAGLDSKVLKGDPLVPLRMEQVYEPNRLMGMLVAGSRRRGSSLFVPPPRLREQSRQLSVAANAVRELDKIIIYRAALKKNRFPGYFLTKDGREFLETLRQSESGQQVATKARRQMCVTPPHVRPVAAGTTSDSWELLSEPIDVCCVPTRLDLGFVRRDESITTTLHLCNSAEREAAYRVVSEPSPIGLRVQPQCGIIPPLSEEILHVQFVASCQLRSRTLYTELILMVEEVGMLQIPVVACVGGGACGDILLQESRESKELLHNGAVD